MTRRQIVHATVGVLGFAIFYWAFWSYTFADMSWPISSLTWPAETPNGYGGAWRFWLMLFALLGTFAAFFACSVYDEW